MDITLNTAVAIAYNTGGFKPSKGLKQGHFNGTKFYGEAVFDFLRLSQTVSVEDLVVAPLPPPPPGTAPVPPPTPMTATGAFFEVDVIESMLNVREEPVIPSDDAASKAGVVAKRTQAANALSLNEVTSSGRGMTYKQGRVAERFSGVVATGFCNNRVKSGDSAH